MSGGVQPLRQNKDKTRKADERFELIVAVEEAIRNENYPEITRLLGVCKVAGYDVLIKKLEKAWK